MQQNNTKHYYIGRREFVEVYDSFGEVAERRFTGHNFNGWYISDPNGPIVFTQLKFAPSWVDLMDSRRPYENDVVTRVCAITDFAPPGFDGRYICTQEPHCPVDQGVYFKTLKHGVVVALDTNRKRFYVNTQPLDSLLWGITGLGLDHYCRRFLKKRSVMLNSFSMVGVAGGPFVLLDTLRPLFEDAGRLWNKKGGIRALAELADAIQNIDYVGKRRRVLPRFADHALQDKTLTRARVVFDPNDHNKFKVFVEQREMFDDNPKIVYCVKGHFDHNRQTAIVNGSPFTTREASRQMRATGVKNINTLYRHVVPAINYIGHFSRHFRAFHSHAIGFQNTFAVRLYTNLNGKTFVNLHDLFFISRLDAFPDAHRLVASQPIIRYDLSDYDPGLLYDKEMRPVSDNAHTMLRPDNTLVSLYQAWDFFGMMTAKHKERGTHALRHGEPYAIRRMRDMFQIDDERYAALHWER